MARQGELIRFAEAPYAPLREQQLKRVAAVASGSACEALFLGTHAAVITLGRGSKRANLFPKNKSLPPGLTLPPVVEIERGGDVTFHGPGQLVGYPILNLKASGSADLHAYLRAIEQVLIDALAEVGVTAGRKAKFTGVWVANGERKIASVGIAVKQWVSYHGFALNVSTNLNYFSLLNPCGLEASVMTSVANELGREVELESLVAPILKACDAVLGVQFR